MDTGIEKRNNGHAASENETMDGLQPRTKHEVLDGLQQSKIEREVKNDNGKRPLMTEKRSEWFICAFLLGTSCLTPRLLTRRVKTASFLSSET